MQGIVKQYPGVKALAGVDFAVRAGSIHCLVGENGAGKSTLIKIITGAEKPTAGQMWFDGRPYQPRSVRDALQAGISTVFQELNVVEQMTVADNLTLGREEHRLGIVRSNPNDPVLRLMAEFAPDIALHRRIASLSFAEKQIVETVKAIGAQAKLVIMDEPTASLSEAETKRIYYFVRQLRAGGIAVIFISHLLDDIFTLGDEVTVLRDGQIVGTRSVAATTREELVRLMVGKAVHGGYQPRAAGVGEVLLQANALRTAWVRDVSFTLRRGEIIGFYGLRGSGKTETARALLGLDPLLSGEVALRGQRVRLRHPAQALRHGLAMVPEERLTQGLVMKLPVQDNIVLANLRRMARLGVVQDRRKREVAARYMKELNIRAHSGVQKAGTLSGGNQQKVVIAKYLYANSQILLLDEPTRGIDIGSKEEIYAIIRKLAQDGAGILVFSSEYDEIAALCDRVALMVDGALTQIIDHSQLDPQQVRLATMGKGA